MISTYSELCAKLSSVVCYLGCMTLHAYTFLDLDRSKAGALADKSQWVSIGIFQPFKAWKAYSIYTVRSSRLRERNVKCPRTNSARVGQIGPPACVWGVRVVHCGVMRYAAEPC